VLEFGFQLHRLVYSYIVDYIYRCIFEERKIRIAPDLAERNYCISRDSVF